MIEKIAVFGIKHCIEISNIHQSVLYRWNAFRIIQQQPKISLRWLEEFSNDSDTHLLWDCFSGHKSAVVKERLVTVDHSFIPPKTTFVCQPLDVGVNKPFKDNLGKLWNEWAATEMGVTRSGCWQSASVEKLLQWIDQSWKDIKTMTVLNSFRKALE